MSGEDHRRIKVEFGIKEGRGSDTVVVVLQGQVQGAGGIISPDCTDGQGWDMAGCSDRNRVLVRGWGAPAYVLGLVVHAREATMLGEEERERFKTGWKAAGRLIRGHAGDGITAGRGGGRGASSIDGQAQEWKWCGEVGWGNGYNGRANRSDTSDSAR
nr:hypothetical protein CFP56_23905 [Quercus suber]